MAGFAAVKTSVRASSVIPGIMVSASGSTPAEILFVRPGQRPGRGHLRQGIYLTGRQTATVPQQVLDEPRAKVKIVD